MLPSAAANKKRGKTGQHPGVWLVLEAISWPTTSRKSNMTKGPEEDPWDPAEINKISNKINKSRRPDLWGPDRWSWKGRGKMLRVSVWGHGTEQVTAQPVPLRPLLPFASTHSHRLFSEELCAHMCTHTQTLNADRHALGSHWILPQDT